MNSYIYFRRITSGTQNTLDNTSVHYRRKVTSDESRLQNIQPRTRRVRHQLAARSVCRLVVSRLQINKVDGQRADWTQTVN